MCAPLRISDLLADARLTRDQNATNGFWALNRTNLAISPNTNHEASM